MADLDASTEAAELDARGMTALAAGKARPVALRAFTLAAGAALSLGALYAGGIPYAGYEVHYGRFGWGPFELAFLVNYLVFGTIAIALGGAAIALGGGPRLAAAVDGLGRLAPTCVRAVVLVALAALAVLITTTRLFLLRDTAITDDEHVYAFMARVFAAGGLWAPSPPEPIRAFFDNQFIVNNGKWYGMFFPGHGFLLAAGELLGLVRWVPMLSALATAALAFAVARRVFGPRVAILTLAGLVVSPYFVMSSATLLAHSTSALFLMIFVDALLRAQDDGASPAWWLIAGLAVGCAGLTRPLAAAAFVVPWGVWVLLRLRHDPTRARVLGTALLTTGGLIAFGVLCVYNVALAGHPLTTGYHTYSALYRFPVDIGAVKAAAPLPSVYELGYTVERFNFWVFGWPLSLALLPFFRRSAADVLIFLSTAAVVVAYAASTLPTINATGPAHYSELAAFLVMLSASGLDRLVERARAFGAERLVLGAVAAAVICACVAFLPVYGGSLRAMSALARLPYDLVAERRLDRAVVFVHGLPSLTWRPGAWVYFHRNPSPDLSDPVLFVKDLGPERNQAIMQAMPGRAPFAMGVKDNRLLLVPLRP